MCRLCLRQFQLPNSMKARMLCRLDTNMLASRASLEPSHGNKRLFCLGLIKIPSNFRMQWSPSAARVSYVNQLCGLTVVWYKAWWQQDLRNVGAGDEQMAGPKVADGTCIGHAARPDAQLAHAPQRVRRRAMAYNVTGSPWQHCNPSKRCLKKRRAAQMQNYSIVCRT